VISKKAQKNITLPNFEGGQKEPEGVIPSDIHEGSESLHEFSKLPLT